MLERRGAPQVGEGALRLAGLLPRLAGGLRQARQRAIVDRAVAERLESSAPRRAALTASPSLAARSSQAAARALS
ncbi:MAG: hypothetical protein WKG00_13770 [Polyangiaceae bacterium]